MLRSEGLAGKGVGNSSASVSVKPGSPEEMIELGRLLGNNLFAGAIVGLSGPLGAGKTTLARGIAEGLGLDEGYIVSSPTYTIMQNYPCDNLVMCHLDLYRIEGVDDLDSTGYRDASGEGSVLVVEWPEKEPEVLSKEHLMLDIAYLEEGRLVTIIPRGPHYEKVITKIAALIKQA